MNWTEPPAVAGIPGPARNDLFVLLPPKWAARTVIAGSAAAYYSTSRDIDLWTLCADLEEANEAQAQITAHLEARHALYSGYHIEFAIAYPNRNLFRYLKVRSADLPRPVQFMVYPWPSADKLLTEFDISCHARGVDLLTGAIFEPRCFQPLHLHPWITAMRFDTPWSTLRRVYAFANRYDRPVDHKSVLQLVTAILETQKPCN